MAALVVKKAVAKSGGIRSFMKTQKNELKQMQVVESNAAAAANPCLVSEPLVAMPAQQHAATLALP